VQVEESLAETQPGRDILVNQEGGPTFAQGGLRVGVDGHIVAVTHQKEGGQVAQGGG
jgi:hypothetical protein